jgi:hypothetical protein
MAKREDLVELMNMAEEAGDMDTAMAILNDLEVMDIEDATPSKAESAARGALQGSTLGFGDEIMGRVAQGYIGARKALGIDPEDLFEGDVYEQARDEIRGENQAAREANPLTYGASEFAGSVVPAVATGGGGAIPQIAKAGLYGGTYGAGSSEGETMGEVMDDAMTTGLMTAGTAGLLKGTGVLASKGKGLLDKGAEKVSSYLPGNMAVTGGDLFVGGVGLLGGPAAAVGSLVTKKATNKVFQPLVTMAAGNKTAQKAAEMAGKTFTPGQTSKYLTGLLQAIHDDSTSP